MYGTKELNTTPLRSRPYFQSVRQTRLWSTIDVRHIHAEQPGLAILHPEALMTGGLRPGAFDFVDHKAACWSPVDFPGFLKFKTDEFIGVTITHRYVSGPFQLLPRAKMLQSSQPLIADCTEP